ncbi:hypothetical protein TNCV_816471 [Trichonephila clavipes]|nr:hypothetical protein TNCV_816471 [Trichonephila clavipes]
MRIPEAVLPIFLASVQRRSYLRISRINDTGHPGYRGPNLCNYSTTIRPVSIEKESLKYNDMGLIKGPLNVSRQCAFSCFQRSSSQRLIEDEAFIGSDIFNNLIDYEDGQEESDSLRADKNMQRDPAFQQIGKAFFKNTN